MLHTFSLKLAKSTIICQVGGVFAIGLGVPKHICHGNLFDLYKVFLLVPTQTYLIFVRFRVRKDRLAALLLSYPDVYHSNRGRWVH